MTLRCWIHEIFIHSRTVSLLLEDNDASKCSSNYFHTQNTCHHVRNTVKITLQYFIVLQSQGVKVKGEGKNNGVNLSHSFPRILDLLPTIREQKNIKV